MKPDIPHFLDILEEVTDGEDKAYRDKGTEFRHNPSSATMLRPDGKVVGACLRGLWYKASGVPPTESKEFTNKLQAGFGNAIHTWMLEKWGKSSKVKVTPEDPGKMIVDPLTRQISFRLDGLVNYRGDIGGVEIKTQQGFGLQRMVKENGPKDSDLLQILSYFGTNDTIKWFSLVYVARDSGYRAEYHVYPDGSGGYQIEGIMPRVAPKAIVDLNFQGIVKRWKELEEAVDSGTIPARDYKAVLKTDGTVTDKRTKNGVDYKTAYQCNYCNWKTKCWSGEDAYAASINPTFERP